MPEGWRSGRGSCRWRVLGDKREKDNRGDADDAAVANGGQATDLIAYDRKNAMPQVPATEAKSRAIMNARQWSEGMCLAWVVVIGTSLRSRASLSTATCSCRRSLNNMAPRPLALSEISRCGATPTDGDQIFSFSRKGR